MAESIFRYQLCETIDPEERLEDAALAKAIHDEFGDQVQITAPRAKEDDFGGYTLGRGRLFKSSLRNPVDHRLPYWFDQAFLSLAQRQFVTLPINEAEREVARLHALGLGAFVKSTLQKHAIFRIPVGKSFDKEIGEMAFSFIDGGPNLMVQELCKVEFEHRFFCIGREIVTHSPNQARLTPLDPVVDGALSKTPNDITLVFDPHVFQGIQAVAERMAASMAYPHAVIDCAMINGKPGVVELNPLVFGQFGIFAGDVRKLAKGIRKLLPSSPRIMEKK